MQGFNKIYEIGSFALPNNASNEESSSSNFEFLYFIYYCGTVLLFQHVNDVDMFLVECADRVLSLVGTFGESISYSIWIQ